ncbi:MAG: hypothetical protein HY688_03325 [Chloroflexi bacterium]|nr:hypothetical protein [Chloroflexota bacterium]
MKELPSRLDNSVWTSFPFSGSTTSGLKSALLFLGLCDADYRPAETLQRLIGSPEEQRKGLLHSLVDRCYRPRLGSMELQRATRRDLKEAFQRSGLRGETADKAVIFFASFAKAAEVPIHEQVAVRKIVQRRPTTLKKIVLSRNGQGPEDETSAQMRIGGVPREGLLVDLHPAVAGLLHLLPPKGERLTVWEHGLFLQAFNAAVTLIYGPPEGAPRAGP